MPSFGFYKKIYQGRSCRNAFFTLYFISDNRGVSEVGFVVGKRCLKLAVARNRLKRLLRETYRLNKPKFKKKFDIIIVARKIDFLLNYKNVEERIMDLFKKAGMIDKF